MLPISEIPIEAWQWLGIAVILLVLAIRSRINYKKTKNEITGFFAALAPVASFTYAIWGFPLLFSQTSDLIRYTAMIGDVALSFVVAAHGYLLWLIILKSRKMPLWSVMIPAAVFGALSMYESISAATSDPLYSYFAADGTLFVSKLPSSLSVLFAMFFIPLGVHFIVKTFSAKGLTAKLRSIALGIMYTGLGAIEIYTNSISETNYSEDSARIIILIIVLVFAAFFFGIAWLSKKR